MTRIWLILIRALKSLKNLHFDWSFSCKVYNVWPKKNPEELSFMMLKCHAKFEENLTWGLESDMRNLADFHQNTWNCQNWNFDEMVLSKELCVMTLKIDEKFEEELTCCFKIDIRNLTNFDSSTRKSRKFALSWAAFDKSI